MTKTILRSLFGLVLLGALGACGSQSQGDAGALVGAYTLDVDKTWATRSDVMLAGTADVRNEVTRALKAQFTPDTYRFELLGDGRFTLRVGAPPAGIAIEGTWRLEGDGVELQANRVDGAPADPEDAPFEGAHLEGEWLVLTDAGTPVYLRRLWITVRDSGHRRSGARLRGRSGRFFVLAWQGHTTHSSPAFRTPARAPLAIGRLPSATERPPAPLHRSCPGITNGHSGEDQLRMTVSDVLASVSPITFSVPAAA